MRGTRHWTYQPPLDGLRAIAVVAVVVYHLGAGWAGGGYLGVDTFFVLSGFLITSLLLSEHARSTTISVTAFWARRARRLLPALILVLFAVAIYAAWMAEPQQLESLRGDMFATLFYGANWRFISTGQSYFALFSDASPLRHAWSLAIEEQFYLVWPLVTLGCLKLARGRHWLLAAVCVVGTAASAFVMAQLYDAADLSRAYYGTDGRAQLLFVGALLAIVLTHWTPERRAAIATTHVLGALGAGYVFWSFATVADTDEWMYRGGYVLFALAVVLLITSVIQPDRTPLRAALSLPPIVWIGRISYGIYLWHWPVIVVASPDRTGLDGAELTLLRVGVTLALATLSFYLVELPIREGRALHGRVAIAAWPAAFVGTSVVVVVATLGAAPLASYYVSKPNQVIAAGPTAGGKNASEVESPTRMLLVGDSIAASLYDQLAVVAGQDDIAMSSAAFPGCGLLRGEATTASGTPISSEACEPEILRLQTTSELRVRPDVVVWLSVWEILDRVVDGQRYRLGTPDGNQVFANLIDETAGRLKVGGAKLVVLLPAQSTEHAFLPNYSYREQVDRLAELRNLLSDYAARNPETTSVIDLTPIVCPGGPPCPEVVDDLELRPDGSHFEADGAQYVADRLVPLLKHTVDDKAATALRAP